MAHNQVFTSTRYAPAFATEPQKLKCAFLFQHPFPLDFRTHHTGYWAQRFYRFNSCCSLTTKLQLALFFMGHNWRTLWPGWHIACPLGRCPDPRGTTHFSWRRGCLSELCLWLFARPCCMFNMNRGTTSTKIVREDSQGTQNIRSAATT